ncbi:enoyl-CoA hydratase/isomerase family protein [Pseudomonadota bacterium]
MLKTIDHGKVREIRLNRPPANALSPELVEMIIEALEKAGVEAGAVVMSGLPGMFSGGLDVPQLIQRDRDDMSTFWYRFLYLLKTIANMPVPIAFALTGHAPAGGIVMAIFGDFRVMPRGGYKTGMNEVQVGLVVPPPVYRALVRAVGPHVAERILVAGEMMSSESAAQIGLVDELADDPASVVARAIEWCELHLALPQPALLATRKMARADLHGFFESGSELGVDEFLDLWFSESTRSALMALLDRLSKK